MHLRLVAATEQWPETLSSGTTPRANKARMAGTRPRQSLTRLAMNRSGTTSSPPCLTSTGAAGDALAAWPARATRRGTAVRWIADEFAERKLLAVLVERGDLDAALGLFAAYAPGVLFTVWHARIAARGAR